MKSSDSLQTSQNLCVILVTCPTDKASELAKSLIEARVAACVNITSEINSVYFWQGNICSDNEKLLIIKTLADKLDSLERIVKENHPYTVPEFVVLPSMYVSDSYYDWVKSFLSGSM